MKAVVLPRNIFVQSGRLYFRKRYNGTTYNAGLGLVDSDANRRTASHISAELNAVMRQGKFDPRDFDFLSRYHIVVSSEKFVTFAEYVDIWLDRKSMLAPATFRTYKALTKKHLIPYFGQMYLEDIGKLVVEKWLRLALGNMSRAYAKECLRRLKSILSEAEDDYDLHLRVNKVKAPRSYEVGKSIEDKIYTLEEASKLYFVMGVRLRTMMLCSMLAGLRTGEVIALKREDVDFERNRVRVRANMSEGERKCPKSWAAVRDIPMHPVLEKHLKELLAGHDDDFVFVSNRGMPFSRPQCFNREYRLAIEKAGVRELRWYAFRKLFASIRFACSDDVAAEIARDMGHRDVALSLNTYSRAMIENAGAIIHH